MTDRVRPVASYTGAERCVAMIVSEPALAGLWRDAVALVDGQVLSVWGWEAVAASLVAPAVAPLLLVEAEGVADAVLAAVLPRLDAFAAALDLPVIVALGAAQIDAVAAHLLGGAVQLLCAPTTIDRVAALAVAAELAGAPSLNDTWREGEASRLQRLNQEVARIAEILARLTRDDADAAIEDRRRSYDAGPATDPGVDAQEVRRAIRTRRARDQFFGAGLFEDPAWDMLLDLYAAEIEHSQVSVSSLCIAAAVAPTTALRWISKMTEAGLFVRKPDPQDRRRAFMALSPQASEAMRRYMAAVRKGELGIA